VAANEREFTALVVLIWCLLLLMFSA